MRERILSSAMIVFLVGGLLLLGEVRQVVGWRWVDAEVLNGFVTREGKNQDMGKEYFLVKFRYYDPEDKAFRTVERGMPATWRPRSRGDADGPETVRVRYYPGDRTSAKIADREGWWAVVGFVVSLVGFTSALIGFIVLKVKLRRQRGGADVAHGS